MLGPCLLRRRATRTARCATLVPSTNALHSKGGVKVAAVSGVDGFRTAGLDETGKLHIGVDDGSSDPITGREQGQPRHSSDKEFLQLASKPQPRARARPSPAQATAGDSSPDSDTFGQRVADDAPTPCQDGVGGPAEDMQCCPSSLSLQHEQGPMGLKAKTITVRRKIMEQGFNLLTDQSLGDPLLPRVGNLMHSTGGRVAQRRLAQLNKATKRMLRVSRKAATEANTGDDTDLEAPSTSAPSTASTPLGTAGRLSYGYPPLSSLHSDVSVLPDTPVQSTIASSQALSLPAPASRRASPGVASPAAGMAASVEAVNSASSKYYELPIPGSMPRPTRAEVERLIRECTDLGALRILYGMYGVRLAREELVLLVNQLAEVHDPSYMTVKLWTATQAMLVELLQRITPMLKELTMQEYVMMLASVAKLRYVPPSDWIAAVLTQSKPRLYNASPSHLAHVLKAIARITVDPSDVKSAATWEGWMRRFLTAVQRQLPTFRADELVKTLVALSELRYRPLPEWMHKFSAALHSRLDVLEAHSLSEVMLAFAALRYQPEGPFLRAYYSQLYARLPLADDEDLATYAQAAALLDRVIRQDFMQEFLAEVVEKLPTFKPQHLANLLNAMGRLAIPTTPDRVRVPPGWTSAVSAHVGANLSAFSGSALASAAWGLSMLSHKAKPQFLDDLLSASYGKLHTCGPTDLILLVTALGNFGFEPMPGREALWATWTVEFERFAGRKVYDTRGVCDLMDALARVPRPLVPAPRNGELRPRPLHPDFVAGVLRSTRIYQLRNTSPSRLAALAGALATLGVRPDFGFLYNYAQAARVMWTSFNTRDYATLLGAMVHIGSPGLTDSRWAADFLAITLCRISEFDGPSLTASLDALRRLPKPEFTPSSQWLAAAVNRAVELIRSPPPPAAATAAELAPIPAAAMAAVSATVAPLPILAPHQSASGVSGVSASVNGKPASSADWWVPPMRPLNPELLVVLVEALAALGYRTEPKAPFVQILRNLLSTTAARLQLQERVGTGAAVTIMPALGEIGPLQHLQEQELLQQQQNGSMAAAAAAAAAFERAKAAAVTAAAVATGEVPRPPLDRQQAAALEAALGILLGLTLPQDLPLAPAALGSAGPMMPDLPRTAIRTAEDIAAADAAFATKRALRAQKRASRPAQELDELAILATANSAVFGSSNSSDNDTGNPGYDNKEGSSSKLDTDAAVGRPGVRIPPYNPESSGQSPQQQPVPAAGAAAGAHVTGGLTRSQRGGRVAQRRRVKVRVQDTSPGTQSVGVQLP
ncbi:hypothetical protein Vretimale_2505 [Volvox reticuliferus]|nr:hypothetical protein Vretimale_2505 [Volvox reticuliferus]